MYSKFHFTRVFQRATGLTPGRFLTMVRLHKAKQLLLTTSLSVTDISHLVGYASVGTFSTTFCNTVGVPPSAYRKMGGVAEFCPNAYPSSPKRFAWQVSGHVRLGPGVSPGPTFVGLFPSRMPQGRPVRCTVLDSPGPYVLHDVPPGSWYAVACSLSQEADALPDRGQTMSVGFRGPLTMQGGPADIRLRPLRAMDPPVLSALPDLRPVPVMATAEAAAA
jgi:hypothetical protein